MEAAVTERDAPGKVNLGLAVLARRGDGFHEIDTLLAALDLRDTVRVTLRDASEGSNADADAATPIALTVHAPDAPGFDDGVPTDERNLAWKAAAGFRAAALAAGGAAPSVHIELTKRVPVAAGLGGGSSDAAAVLAALDDLRPDAGVDLDALALELGSDVPFFLGFQRGRWTAARGRGRGERLEALAVPPRALVLVHPGVGVSAAEAYAELQTFSRRPRWEAIVEALATGERPRWVNALQPGVLLLHPEVRSAFDAVRAADGVDGALMSGSGSVCFGLVDVDVDAEGVADRLRDRHPDWWVAAVRLRGVPSS